VPRRIERFAGLADALDAKAAQRIHKLLACQRNAVCPWMIDQIVGHLLQSTIQVVDDRQQGSQDVLSTAGAFFRAFLFDATFEVEKVRPLALQELQSILLLGVHVPASRPWL